MNLDTKQFLSFESANLVVDWISFNIQGLPNPQILATKLSKNFVPSITVNDKPDTSYHGFQKKYKVSIKQYTQGYWIGTRIIFSGKNAQHFYNLIKTQKFDWKILNLKGYPLSLSRIDLYYSRTNTSMDTNESFDKFLIDSRNHIKSFTPKIH